MTTAVVTVRVVNVDVVHAEGGGAVDAECLNGSVLDTQVVDPGVGERVGVEEPEQATLAAAFCVK